MAIKKSQFPQQSDPQLGPRDDYDPNLGQCGKDIEITSVRSGLLGIPSWARRPELLF